MGSGVEPEAVRVWLLGGFEVAVGSRSVEARSWRRRKSAAVVKLLALEKDHRLHRDRVTETLWPYLDARAAANNLHRALFFARRALEPEAASTSSRYLVLADDVLALCPESPPWVDVEAFEEAAAMAQGSESTLAYRAALELYAGELLPDDLYEGWTEARRVELRETHLSLLLDLAGLHEEIGEYGAAIEVLRQAVSEEPTSEEAHRNLMRLYALSGRRGRAIAQFERLLEALADDAPDTTTQRLHDEIRTGAIPPPAHRPPRTRAGSPPNNLPAPLTSFVGRESALAEVGRLLRGTRLLTLTGAGGSGKTRLALKAAQEIASTYPDGVWLVELASLADPALVPPATAQALGIGEQPNRSPIQTLAEHLRTRELLLVLDNCEHLADAAASLTEALLKTCPKLRVLATSPPPTDRPRAPPEPSYPSEYQPPAANPSRASPVTR